jgi:hypothetical protein
MRTVPFIISLIIIISQTGCKHTTEPIVSDMYVNIEAESSFQDNAVKIIVDNQILLDSRITTNDVLSLAWSSGLQKLSRNHHTLQFTVIEYGIQKNYSIDNTNDTSTVLLRFDKVTKQISIQQIKGKILRD